MHSKLGNHLLQLNDDDHCSAGFGLLAWAWNDDEEDYDVDEFEDYDDDGDKLK